MAGRTSLKHKIKSLLRVTSTSIALFGGICLYQGNEKFYEEVAMPLVRLIDPEVAHKVAVTAVKYGLISSQKFEDPTCLKTSLWNLTFKNPVGIAAGFDKQGEAVQGLHKIGFSFVEIGSVTPNPQPGNPKPRVFRLSSDNAIINRYGFNSDGHDSVYERLKSVKNDADFSGIIGVNLGKNKTSNDPVQDYIDGIKKFHDVANYFVINVSSPNTPGLRNLQAKENLQDLLRKLNETRQVFGINKPLLLKLAPDLSETERQDIVNVIQNPKSKVDGLVISNTTISRMNLMDAKKEESGGLSGAPLTDLSTKMISDMYRRTGGNIPIIGVGGVFTGADAYDKIKAGASLVQIYTSYIYHGPPVINRIKRELTDLLKTDGFNSVADAVGRNSKS